MKFCDITLTYCQLQYLFYISYYPLFNCSTVITRPIHCTCWCVYLKLDFYRAMLCETKIMVCHTEVLKEHIETFFKCGALMHKWISVLIKDKCNECKLINKQFPINQKNDLIFFLQNDVYDTCNKQQYSYTNFLSKRFIFFHISKYPHRMKNHRKNGTEWLHFNPLIQQQSMRCILICQKN